MISDYDEFEPLTFYQDKNFLIASMPLAQNGETYVYNTISGAVTSANFNIQNQYRIGNSYFYYCQHITNTWNQGFFRLNDSGQFVSVANIPADPTFHYNGKSYGINGHNLYEMSDAPFPFSSRNIAVFPVQQEPFRPRYFEIINDTVYFSSLSRFLMFSMADSSFHEPYAAFTESLNLEVVPFSGLNGRFLYNEPNGNDDVRLYEFGRGLEPASLINNNEVKKNLKFWYGQSNYRSNYHEPGCFSTSGNTTWIFSAAKLLGGLSRDEEFLLKVDRSLGTLTLVKEHFRNSNIGRPAAALAAMDNGNKLCAIGLLGPEGYEPYGIEHDTLRVLQDFIPGFKGSADYEMNFTINHYKPSENPVIWKDRSWFVAGHLHYGNEITYSDGTAEGTALLADIVPGGAGIRVLRLIPTEEKMYALIQREDLTIGIYIIGPEIGKVKEKENDPGTWVLDVGLYPESVHEGIEDAIQNPKFFQGTSGDYFYLSDHGLLKSMSFGVPGLSFFESNITSNLVFIATRLQRLERNTGKVIFSKQFAYSNALYYENNFQADEHPDGTIKLLLIGNGAYQDINTYIPPTGSMWGTSSKGLNIISFSQNGEFISTIPIVHQERMGDVIFTKCLDNGTILAVTTDEFNGRSFYVMLINQNGAIQKLLTLLQPSQVKNIHTRFDDVNEELWLSVMYNATDCSLGTKVSFTRFDSNLAPKVYPSYCFSGNLAKPELFIRSKGELWYTGASNGKIRFTDSATEIDLTTENNLYTTFSIVKVPQIIGFNIINTLNQQTTHYFGTIERNGELFVQFTALNPVRPPVKFSSYLVGWEFHPDAIADFITIQLNKTGGAFDMQKNPIRISALLRDIHHKGVIDDEGYICQLFKAGTNNAIHFDTLTAPPLFEYALKYKVQITRKKWVFGESTENVEISTPGPLGNFLSVFPNPSSGTLFLIPKNGNAIPFKNYSIIDVQGRIVKAGLLPDNFNYLSLELPPDLSDGVYQLLFLNESAKEMHRIVLSR